MLLFFVVGRTNANGNNNRALPFTMAHFGAKLGMLAALAGVALAYAVLEFYEASYRGASLPLRLLPVSRIIPKSCSAV